MAGTTLGLVPTHRRTLRLVPNTTRTRRCHGVFIAGNELAVIYSARREASAPGVLLELGNENVEHSWNITPAQARAMARALAAAADAAGARRVHALVAVLPARAGADIPCALPGRWREEGGLDDLMWLDVQPTTPGMVVVAKASDDWHGRPHLRWQTWPDLLTPSADATQPAEVDAAQAQIAGAQARGAA